MTTPLPLVNDARTAGDALASLYLQLSGHQVDEEHLAVFAKSVDDYFAMYPRMVLALMCSSTKTYIDLGSNKVELPVVLAHYIPTGEGRSLMVNVRQGSLKVGNTILWEKN